jgi:mannose-6-phosphate isomerase-like protein (cupin superfamily)
VLVRLQHREETLSAGDTAVFPAYLPHRIEKRGRAKAQVLIVVA